jgi:hypothetical protein
LKFHVDCSSCPKNAPKLLEENGGDGLEAAKSCAEAARSNPPRNDCPSPASSALPFKIVEGRESQSEEEEQEDTAQDRVRAEEQRAQAARRARGGVHVTWLGGENEFWCGPEKM